jgi:FKBP-type peptidyl-prolyl cis-trans isomerase 2
LLLHKIYFQKENKMAEAKVGDEVKVRYSGSLEDGTVIGSSPLEAEFTIGEESVLPGFENAVIGMNEGDTKNFSLAPEDAFGDRREDLILNVEKTKLPPDIDVKQGMALQVRSDEGAMLDVTVVHVDDEIVTLDGNHPLAGKTINFDIELVEIS